MGRGRIPEERSLCYTDDSNANDGKTGVVLKNEIRDTGNLLGWKSDWETEKYEEKYLIEIPPKENCRIM